MYVYLYADWIDCAEEAVSRIKWRREEKKAASHEVSPVDYLRVLHYVPDLYIHVSFRESRECTRVIEFDQRMQRTFVRSYVIFQI